MTKRKFKQAYMVFKRIAKSNKQKFDELVELDELKQEAGQLRPKLSQVEHIQLRLNLNESDNLAENHVIFSSFFIKYLNMFNPRKAFIVWHN